MEQTEKLKTLDTFLKTLRRGVEQLRAEYRMASSSIWPHIQELRRQGIQGPTKTLKQLQRTQGERHYQLEELVPRMRTAQIHYLQATQRSKYGSLEAATAPLLVSLLEMAMSKDPLPDSHLMWSAAIDPLFLMSAERDIVGLTSDRRCPQLWGLSFKDMHFIPKLRGTTLRELRTELLQLAAEEKAVAPETPNPLHSRQRVAFEALRARLIDELSPEEFALLKEFSSFI